MGGLDEKLSLDDKKMLIACHFKRSHAMNVVFTQQDAHTHTYEYIY